MGDAVSKAREKQAEEEEKLNSLLAILENKRLQFIEKVQLVRGEDSKSTREVSGGRTVSRISQTRVQTSEGADPRIENTVADFITAAQGGDKAKNAAVTGATTLLQTGLDALFGAGSASGAEKEGFVCLFLNYAFVRVDFYVYTYSVSGNAWGAVANESGSCYVADIAVLDPVKDVKAWEIDYLLAQSLSVPKPEVGEEEDPDSEFYTILKMKIQLVESTILSRLLDQEDITLEQLKEYTTQLIETQKLIVASFNGLADFKREDFEEIEPPTPPASPTPPPSTTVV